MRESDHLAYSRIVYVGNQQSNHPCTCSNIQWSDHPQLNIYFLRVVMPGAMKCEWKPTLPCNSNIFHPSQVKTCQSQLWNFSLFPQVHHHHHVHPIWMYQEMKLCLTQWGFSLSEAHSRVLSNDCQIICSFHHLYQWYRWWNWYLYLKQVLVAWYYHATSTCSHTYKQMAYIQKFNSIEISGDLHIIIIGDKKLVKSQADMFCEHVSRGPLQTSWCHGCLWLTQLYMLHLAELVHTVSLWCSKLMGSDQWEISDLS